MSLDQAVDNRNAESFEREKTEKFSYDGFISYRHSEEQTAIVREIQEALHRFAKPFWKLRALRLYRDESNLSARPDLWGEIVEALDGCKYLLLIASTEAAKSKWVQRETEHWLARRGNRNLIILLTDGEIVWDDTAQQFDRSRTTAIPNALLTSLATEPLYVDLRWASNPAVQLTMSNPRFADAVATIAAELHGKSKDELAGIDVREHRRWRWIRNTGATAISVLAVGVVIAAYYWYQQRNKAIAEENIVIARSLAAHAEALLVQHGTLLESAGLFAVESMRRAPSLAADRAIRKVIALLPKRVADMNCARGGPVKYGIFSPSGQYLATINGDDITRVWETSSGRLVSELATGKIEALKFNPLRHHIVALNNGTAAIWDFDSSRRIVTLAQTGVRGSVFSPDGVFLVTVGDDKTTRVWDGSRYDEVTSIANSEPMLSVAVAPRAEEIIAWNRNIAEVFRSPGPRSEIRETGAPTAFQYSSDGAHLLQVAPSRYNAWLFETTSHQSLLYENRYWDATFSQDGTVLAAASPEWIATAYDLRSCSRAGVKWVATANATLRPVDIVGRSSCLSFGKVHHDNSVLRTFLNSDGSLLGTTSEDGTARVWETYYAREVLRLLERTEGKIKELSFSGDGERVTGWGPDTCRTWISTGGRQIAALRSEDGITDVAFSRDGTRMATVSLPTIQTNGKASARVWTVPDGHEVGRISLPGLQGPHSIALNRDGQELLLDHHSVWNVSAAQMVVSIPEIAESKLSAVSVDWDFIAIVTKQNDIAVFNRTGGAEHEVARRDHLEGRVNAIAMSADGCCIAAGIEGKGVMVWRWKTNEEFFLSEPISKVVKAIYDDTGRRLALVGGELSNLIEIFDLATRRQLAPPLQHSAEITSVAFGPNGDYVASSSVDKLVRVWSLMKGKEIAEFGHQIAEFGHDAGALAVAFSPDGRYVLSAGGRSDRAARLWLWRPDELIREACSRLIRKRLTDDEWRQSLGVDGPHRATCPGEITP